MTIETQYKRSHKRKDGRLTKLQDRRLSWDYIIAAHYHYGAGVIAPEVGYGTIARLFEMPLGTVRGIVKRTQKDDPRTLAAARRFRLTRLQLTGLGSDLTARQQDITNLFKGMEV